MKVNKHYVFRPVLIDKIDPCYGVKVGLVKEGDIVKTIKKQGCPKFGTMNHGYIENVHGEFLGLVCLNSLQESQEVKI
jgi:hypothetical protein